MAKQVEDIVVRLVGEGFEALDKIKGSFRELGKVTNLAEKDILSARDSLLDYARKAGNTEAVNKGLTDAFKGLRSQVDLSSEAYRSLSGELRRLDEESKGATRSIMAQRDAVLSSTAAGTQNVAALQQQRAALIALRAQTRDASTAFDQFSADIQAVETRLNNLADVNRRFNAVIAQGTAATAAGARVQLEALTAGIALRRQDLADIDTRSARERNLRATIEERIGVEQRLNTALSQRRRIQFQEGARTGREGARTGAATFNDPTVTAGFLAPDRIAQRLGDLPNTTAGLSQELGELNERLTNTYRNTETYIAVQLRLAAVQRDVTSATQGFGAALLADLNAGTLIPSQKNLAEVIGQLRREMLELDQTTSEGSRAYAENATQVRLLERQLKQLANAYTNVADKARTATAQGTNPFTASGARNPAYAQEQVAALNAALNTADASSLASVDALLNAKRSLYDYEAQVSAQLDQQKDQLAAQDLARVDAQDKKEAAAFQRELNRLDILKQQTAAAREALGFNTQQQLSPLYQQITGLATAGVARQQQFMGRKPSEVLNDIATSFNAGGRGVDLKQRSTEIGGSVAEGVAQGATDSAATAAGAKSFADKLITAYKQAFRIKSPSGESEEKIGVPIGQGIGFGIIKGIKGLKARIQLAIKGVTATPGRAGLPASVGPVSDVADKLQSFLARSSAETSAFLPLTRLMGEGVTGSPALPLAAYRRSYERGGIVSPSFLPVEERRGLRGTPGIPGAGLEEIIRAEAFKAVSRTGAFVGPLSGPQTAGGAIASAYKAGISPGTFQRPTASAASLPLFGAAAQPAPLQRTMPGMAYQMGGSQFAFPTEGQLGAGRTQSFGRGAANASVTEAISTYRKAVDNFWNGETGSFETIRRVVSSGAQLSASKLARNLSETRNSTAALSTAAVQLVSVPGAVFTKLRIGVGQELSEIKATLGEVVQKDLNAVRSGGQKLRQSVSGIGGAVRNAVSPLLGGRYGYLDKTMEEFEQGFMRPRVTGGAAPPVPPVPPVGGGGPSPAANNEFTKLNATLTKFGALNRRSVTDIRQLGGALDALKADLSPLDAEYRQVNKSIEAQQVLIERELGRRERRQRRAPSTGQLVQAGGAAISGGIFGGPEGFLGGVGGAVLGTALPGIGTAGGAFAGAAAGAQVGMFRQQLAGTADYAASIGKLQIALRGVVGSQAAYDEAIRAAAAATRDLNIPQEEATRGLTRLSAAVIGAGGTVADSSFAFRAMSEAIKATGGNAEQVDGALLALTQVFSKGKVSAEELNQIAERLPGTFTLFAQAAGKTGPELQKALEQGEVGLNDLMKFLALTGERFGTTAAAISSSSQDAGARLTVAFQAMRLEVGNALQPLGAELQGAFATFISEITPAVVGSAKALAAALSFFTDNKAAAGLATFALQVGAVALAIKGLQAASAGLVALNVASWFTGAATGIKITGDAAAVAAPKVGLLRGALGGLIALAAKPVVITIVIAGVIEAIKRIGDVNKAFAEFLKTSKELTGGSWLSSVGGGALNTKQLSGLATEVSNAYNFNAAELKRLEQQKSIITLQQNTDATSGAELAALNNRLIAVNTGIDTAKKRMASAKSKLDAIYGQLNAPTAAAPTGTTFPDPTGGEDASTKAADKAARDAEAAAAEQQRLNEALAKAAIAFDDEVFRNRMELIRKEYEYKQELDNKARDLFIKSQTGAARETASTLSGFLGEFAALTTRLVTASDGVKTATQQLKSANAMAATTISPTGAVSAAGRYIQGGIGPMGPNQYGPHFDIKRSDGGFYSRNALDPYVQVNGRPLSSGVTVPGGEYGAPRSYGGHAGRDYAFGGSAAMSLTGGAKWMGNQKGSYGDAAAFMTPDGKVYKVIHGKFEGAAGAGATRQPTGVAAAARRDVAAEGGAATATANLEQAKALMALEERQVKALMEGSGKGFVLDLTDALRQQNAALKDTAELTELRNRLQFAGERTEIIDAEISKAEAVSRTAKQVDLLTQALEGLKAAPKPDEALISFLTEGIANTEEELAQFKALTDAAAASATAPGVKVRAFIGEAKRELADLESVAIRISQGIGDAVGNSIANGISGLIEGTTSVKQLFGEFLKDISQILLKEATKMIATYIAIGIARAFAGMASAASTPTPGAAPQMTPGAIVTPTGFSGQFANMAANGAVFADGTANFAKGGTFANGIQPFANGGIVTRPTFFKFANGGAVGSSDQIPFQRGVMGEAGPEAIIPLKRGANGKLGVQAFANGAGSGSRESFGQLSAASIPFTKTTDRMMEERSERETVDAINNPKPLDVRFESQVINGVEYVTAEQHRKGMTQAAERGRALTLSALQNSVKTRKKVGMA